MLREIEDDELQLLDDDPVRPGVSIDEKIDLGEVLVLENDGMVDAVICIMFTNDIPTTENELLKLSKQLTKDREQGSMAIFYTIWSYKKGSGRVMVIETLKWLKRNMPEIKRYVTLSPLTDMARNFHLRNGAKEIQVNNTTQNFEYK
jgi:hypothetical protein